MKRSELEGKINNLKKAISVEKSSDKVKIMTEQLHSYESRIKALDLKKKNKVAKTKTGRVLTAKIDNIKPLSVAEIIKNNFDLDKVLNSNNAEETKKIKVLATYTLTREIDVPTNFDSEHFDIRKYWDRHLSHKEIKYLLSSLKDVSLAIK